ncbi:MAG TPA: CFI-box-CTERM domain-containing protein, partial [Pyrinomonadaceae bacterium]|nr:CFI-box-CTERM domain-containing protein [Pyrinomonadaceae bacterium]
SQEDKLNGIYSDGVKTYGGCYVTYAGYSKGNTLPDESIAPVTFCHQGYIKVNDNIRRQGISYVLAYAGAVYASTQLGYTNVGTNMPNSNSSKLAQQLGFGKSSGITILPVLTVTREAMAGMQRYGWRVTGGSLAARSGISSSPRPVTDRSRLLDDAPPKSKWCCCFLTTACCRWRGLPDDCEELTLLRHFRDTYLRNLDSGSSAVQHYYEVAPAIATAIEQDQDAVTVYDWIYEVIRGCIDAMQREDYDSVFEQYKQMVLELEARYLVPQL